MSFNERYAKEEKKTFSPPEGVQAAARKALKWIEEGHAGSGFTGVGRGRAHQLANGEAVSLSTIKRMHSFFSRHRVDKQGKDWNKPSPGKVAWYAWGGDAGASWAAGIAKSHDGKKKEAGAAEIVQTIVNHLPVAVPAAVAGGAAITKAVDTVIKKKNADPTPGTEEAYNATGFMSPQQVQERRKASFDERYASENTTDKCKCGHDHNAHQWDTKMDPEAESQMEDLGCRECGTWTRDGDFETDCKEFDADKDFRGQHSNLNSDW